MNQELKNFDILIVELEDTLANEEFSAFKTLLNVYTDIYNKYGSLQFKDLYKDDTGDILVCHNKKLKLFEKHLIEHTFPALVENKDFKLLHTVQILIDKLKELNHYMGIKVEDYLKGKKINESLTNGMNNLVNFNKANYLLDKSIEGGFLITQVADDLRGTGKTESLIKKAHELDVTLVVGMHSTKRLIDEKANEMGFKIDCQYISDLAKAQGRRMKNGKFLVDDSTSNQIIKELVNNRNEFLGGFNSLYISTKYRDKAFDIIQDELSNAQEQRIHLTINYRDEDIMEKLRYNNAKISVLDSLIARYKGVK